MTTRAALSDIIEQLFASQVEFLQQLVRAKSTNPYTPDTSPADAPIENAVLQVICQKLDEFALPYELHGVTLQRQNLLCTLSGRHVIGKTLILNAHMDTVEASSAYTYDPWGAVIEQGRLFGVGVADAKAQIAIFIYAVRALQQAALHLAGTLKMAFVVDEEAGACSPYGTRYLLEQGLLDGDAAIIGEPGDKKIAIGHRGLYRFRITTYGEAIHTGLKEWEEGTQGRNAVLDMARIIQVLSDCSMRYQPSDIFPDRKSVLTFPTLIRGGSAINIVPDRCEAYGDIRLLPGTSAEEMKATIHSCLAPLGLDYDLSDVASIPAVETPRDAPIVRALMQATQQVTGKIPRAAGSGPACDGWMFLQRGIPTICGFGAACGGVHGADEWVDLESLKQVTEIYARSIWEYLR